MGSDPIFIDDELVTLLEVLRLHFGRPGGRHQRVPHCRPQRPHRRSLAPQPAPLRRAADIRVEGVPVEQAAAFAETLLPGAGRHWRYPPRRGRPRGWVHLDVRPTKARWTG